MQADQDAPDGRPQQVDIVITRQQLRALAWVESNVFDDRDLDVIPAASGTHVPHDA